MIEDDGVLRDDHPFNVRCSPQDGNNSFQRCIYDRDSRVIEDFRDNRAPQEDTDRITDESRMMSRVDRLTEVD